MKVLHASKSSEATFARELSMLAAVKVHKREAVWAGQGDEAAGLR